MKIKIKKAPEGQLTIVAKKMEYKDISILNAIVNSLSTVEIINKIEVYMVYDKPNITFINLINNPQLSAIFLEGKYGFPYLMKAPSFQKHAERVKHLLDYDIINHDPKPFRYNKPAKINI